MKKLLVIFALVIIGFTGCTAPGTIQSQINIDDLEISKVQVDMLTVVYVARYKDHSRDSSKIISTTRTGKNPAYTITVDERGNVTKINPVEK